jgi:cardiolipin synthase
VSIQSGEKFKKVLLLLDRFIRQIMPLFKTLSTTTKIGESYNSRARIYMMGGFLMLISILLLVAFFIWIYIDLSLGRKQHKQHNEGITFPKRKGNLTFLSEGSEFFSSLKNDITSATDHIHINFYIFREDSIGREIIQLLKQKANGGVDVRLLLDYVGSYGFPKKTIRQLKEAGASFAFSPKAYPPYFFYSLNKRNHRKITVIDGEIGYMGGYNVGDEYLGKDPKFGVWRDYHLKFSGEGVQDLQHQFIADWKKAAEENLSGSSLYPKLEKGTTSFQLMPTNGGFIEDKFLDYIKHAKKSIVIGSPYYIPGREIQDALMEAAERGVSVQLLLPMKKDHPLVHETAFPYFKPLLKAGCDIYRFYQGFYHSKVFMIDEEMCDVGTANFDRRSFTLNQEMNCFIDDEGFIEIVKDTLKRDFRRSQKLSMKDIKKRSLSHRFKEKIGTAISGLL